MKKAEIELYNIETGETQKPLATNIEFLSPAEAKRLIKVTTRNAEKVKSNWRYRIKETIIEGKKA